MSNLSDVPQQLVGLKKAIMDEVMALDTGAGQGEIGGLKTVRQFLRLWPIALSRLAKRCPFSTMHKLLTVAFCLAFSPPWTAPRSWNSQ